MSDYHRELVRLALVLRLIHHQRYMSIHWRLAPSQWVPFAWYRLVDDAGNRYDTMPLPLDAEGA